MLVTLLLLCTFKLTYFMPHFFFGSINHCQMCMAVFLIAVTGSAVRWKNIYIMAVNRISKAMKLNKSLSKYSHHIMWQSYQFSMPGLSMRAGASAQSWKNICCIIFFSSFPTGIHRSIKTAIYQSCGTENYFWHKWCWQTIILVSSIIMGTHQSKPNEMNVVYLIHLFNTRQTQVIH